MNTTPLWPICYAADCSGSRLDSSDLYCLNHASEEDFKRELASITSSASIEARGVQISGALLEALLNALPRSPSGHRYTNSARFDSAVFEEDAHFDQVMFRGFTSFDASTFRGSANFNAANFQQDASFVGVRFLSETFFLATNFYDQVNFDESIFADEAKFDSAIFGGETWFDYAKFKRNASFSLAKFFNRASFCDMRARFGVYLKGAAFHQDVYLNDSIIRGWLILDDARFESAAHIGPVLALGGISLDRAHFHRNEHLELSTPILSCQRVLFREGVQFRLRWAKVILDDCDFSGPSLLFGTNNVSTVGLRTLERRVFRTRHALRPMDPRPAIFSLRRANVVSLGLSNVDLSECRFAGSHNLDRLRLEGGVNFGRSSAGGRRVIAEERAWRSRLNGDWVPPIWPYRLSAIDTIDTPTQVQPAQIATLYRLLRKSLEDGKDEPGAADFYYGEMEMRRLSAGKERVAERGILEAYRLVSGYGLRAARAIAWLVALIAVMSIMLHEAGFSDRPVPDSIWATLLYTVRSSLSLTNNEVALTSWGLAVQVILKILGPVLLGLTLLAIRARVKR